MGTKKAAGPKVADRARSGKKAAATRDGRAKPEARTARALKEAKAEVAANLARLEAGDAATGGDGAIGEATTAPAPADATGPAVGRDAAKRGKRAKNAGSGDGATSKRGTRKGDKPTSAANPNAPRRVSALDAAAQVLAASEVPMRAKEMIAAMESKGLWKSPGGKTPEATLCSKVHEQAGGLLLVLGQSFGDCPARPRREQLELLPHLLGIAGRDSRLRENAGVDDCGLSHWLTSTQATTQPS